MKFNWNQTGMPVSLVKRQSNAEMDLAEANRRYERLVASLAREGIQISENGEVVSKRKRRKVKRIEPDPAPTNKVSSAELLEWKEWDRKFRSLLG